MVYAVNSSPLDSDTGGGTSYTYKSRSSGWNCSRRREEEEKEEEEEEEEEEMIDDDDDDDNDDDDDDNFLSPASSVITVTVSLTILVIELTAVTVIL